MLQGQPQVRQNFTVLSNVSTLRTKKDRMTSQSIVGAQNTRLPAASSLVVKLQDGEEHLAAFPKHEDTVDGYRIIFAQHQVSRNQPRRRRIRITITLTHYHVGCSGPYFFGNVMEWVGFVPSSYLEFTAQLVGPALHVRFPTKVPSASDCRVGNM